MSEYLATFESLAVLSFGFFILLAGLFTAYFGAGKSRKIGLGLTLVGLVALAFFAFLTWNIAPLNEVGAWTAAHVATGLAAVAGAAVGGLVAIAIFLISIMKA